MADQNQSGLELKGLLLAVIAGVLVVVLAFGVSALMRHAMPEPAPSSASSETTAPPPSTGAYSQQMITMGKPLYMQACASCHGANAKGSIGPNLHNEDMSDNQIAGVIKNGKGQGQMPAFSSKFNDGQINEIIAYLRSLK